MKCNNASIFVLLLGLPLAGLPWSQGSAGEIYKWTDDKGKVHYSDKPPEQTEFERRAIPSEPQRPQSTAAAPPPTPECALARKNLDTLENNPVVLMDTNGDGEAERLEGESLQARIALTKQQIERLCVATDSDSEAGQGEDRE
jgi:hypothetical protein